MQLIIGNPITTEWKTDKHDVYQKYLIEIIHLNNIYSTPNVNL